MAGIPIKYRAKDFQNSTYKKCSLLEFKNSSCLTTILTKIFLQIHQNHQQMSCPLFQTELLLDYKKRGLWSFTYFHMCM